MTVLIGANGSGKNICVQLLMRFWEPDRGRILIGGQDIRDMDSRALAAMIAPVFQETLLFDETIADNIRVSRPVASDAEVEAVVRAAAVHDAVMGSNSVTRPGSVHSVRGFPAVSASGSASPGRS